MMKNTYSTQWFELFMDPIPQNITEKEVSFLAAHLPNPPYTTILDVCCGQGRHANALAAKGYHVTGIDLNPKALEKATQSSRRPTVFHHMDMRNLCELPGTFDSLINLWQSFGYFDEETNLTILRYMCEKLNARGRLILDIYNRDFFRIHQGSRVVETAGMTIRETIVLSGSRLEVGLKYDNLEETERFQWHLYAPHEIQALTHGMGMVCLFVCTNFDITRKATEKAPRMQVFCEKI